MTNPQIQRFYDCQDFMLGKINYLELGNGYQSIEDEYKAILQMYPHTLTTDGYKLEVTK